MSWRKDDFQSQPDNPQGAKVVTYCFLDKREATKTSPGCTLAMVHETLEELDEIRRDGHRSTALMAHCAAADRPDLQHTTSILMRTLETPLKSHEMHVMRPGTHLNTEPDLRWDVQCQNMPDDVRIYVDSY